MRYWRLGPVSVWSTSAPVASVKTLRARQLRVLPLGRWLLVYRPRGHWSVNL